MKGFFSEAFAVSSNVSSLRVMVMMCTITACIVSILGVIQNRDLTGLGMLVGSLLVPSFGGKVMQKKQENMEDNK